MPEAWGFRWIWKPNARSSMYCFRIAHIDHLATLPIFLENTEEFAGTRVTIHGSEAVLDGLRRHVFNGCLWPDLIHATLNSQPFFHLATLEAGRPLEIAGVRITPVPVNHAVPTMGFLLEEGDAAVVLPIDTGPTEELWRRANALPKVNAVFLEATFPNSMDELARDRKTSDAEDVCRRSPQAIPTRQRSSPFISSRRLRPDRRGIAVAGTARPGNRHARQRVLFLSAEVQLTPQSVKMGLCRNFSQFDDFSDRCDLSAGIDYAANLAGSEGNRAVGLRAS